MSTAVIMPKLGLTMAEGTIVEWKKNEGEGIEKGEILYVLETEKVTFEVEAPEPGTLGKITARAGDVVPVGEVVAYILQPGEKAADIPVPVAKTESGPQLVKAPADVPKTRAEHSEVSQRVKISPLAKKMAEEHNIDISRLAGTGPDGRIVKEDVLKVVGESRAATSVSSGEEASSGEEIIPLSSMRRTIARRMAESFQTVPHFWVVDEADVASLVALQTRLAPHIEKETGARLTMTDLLIKIVAEALGKHPNVNASWTDAGIKLLREVNIGIATSVPGGLIVPVIRQADKKSLSETAAARADVVKRGREGKARIDEMSGGTFTLNNVGALGIKYINAIINPPESAILTVGKIADRAVVVNGKVAVRPMMDLSLGADHRTLDGAAAGRFLQGVKELIANPEFLASN